MTERDEEAQIDAVRNKTYAYFNAVLSSLMSANCLLFIYSVIMTMTHTGIDTATDMPADPDIIVAVILGCIAFVCVLLSMFFVWRWFKRIRVLEKKIPTVIVSLVVYIVLIPILGYISLLMYGLILWK